jgi:DNA-binding response OmpR family regulator
VGESVIAQPAPASGGALGPPARPGSGTKGTVLVVEDEPGLADVLAVHLAAAGYTPVVAHDGVEALYALERTTPVAVLLDLQLPRVSGFRLLQLLRRGGAAPRVPVLVLSALSFGEARDALRAGADAFLTKPFRPADVAAQAARLIAGARPAAPAPAAPPRAAPTPAIVGG